MVLVDLPFHLEYKRPCFQEYVEKYSLYLSSDNKNINIQITNACEYMRNIENICILYGYEGLYHDILMKKCSFCEKVCYIYIHK